MGVGLKKSLGALSVTAIALIGAAYAIKRYQGADGYAGHREKAVISQAAQYEFDVVVVGDSFVELADLPAMCGGRVLNAGVSGAKVTDTERFAPQLFQSETPKYVIINVGVNDTHKSVKTDPAIFHASLQHLLNAARTFGAKVLILGIAPFSGQGLSKEFDATHAQRLNKIIQSMGGISVPRLMRVDGLHPSVEGYRVWKSAAQRVCST